MDIFEDEHRDPERDHPRERIIEVPEGAPFILEHYGPHSFWFVRRKHGQVPEKLKGAFTTIQQARLAVDMYIQSQAATSNTPKNRAPANR